MIGDNIAIPPAQAPIFPQQSASCPTCGRPMQMAAMDQYNKANPPAAAIEGPGRPSAGGGSSMTGEVLPPNSVSTQPASIQAQYQQLGEQQRTLMQMGPMAPTLMRLGVTPEQMMKMTPKDAYQFIKARSPQGMGVRDIEGERAVMDAINKIRAQRGILGGLLSGGSSE